MSSHGLSAVEMAAGVGFYSSCSLGMLLFNKLAIVSFPVECTLVGVQMLFAVFCMLACFKTLHFGSVRDVLRWSLVAPFFTGMLLTSILALKHAPMSMVVVFRVLSALLALAIERFYPDPLRVDGWTLLSILAMLGGSAVYAWDMPTHNLISGLPWIFANMLFAVADRLLQRMMLAKEQRPVDISLSGVTMISNAWGFVILLFVAWLKNEFEEVPPALSALSGLQVFWIVGSCVVGTGISFAGVWVQRLISATSFLVLVNMNKFGIIFIEAFIMGTKTLTPLQIFGAVVAISAGIFYGQARKNLEDMERNAKGSLEAKTAQ